ncbi:putative chitosanase CSN1 [Sarocladium strictum]
MRYSQIASLAALGSVASAYDLPDNLRAIYEKHKTGSCENSVSDTFSEGDMYCGDLPNAIFLKGNGVYANMDIDCDGANNYEGDCANDPSGQGQTAFKDTVKKYGITDLDANLHSYVVFGNMESNPVFLPHEPEEGSGLDPMEPLSVMAIVCDDQLFYGVWGDINGGTSTGEASLALAKLCFPDEGLNGNNGHDERDVLYIGFTGSAAQPGADGAAWTASSPEEFADSLRDIGDSLVASLG